MGRFPPDPFIFQAMEKRVFISIGSNLGDRVENCRRAVRLLVGSGKAEVVKESSLYETEPWGISEQGAFVNSVVEVRTALGPAELLGLLKGIEQEMGRAPAVKWGVRIIDLDIVFYGTDVVEVEGLVIPHPRMHERAFVLAPLAEIAPGFKHPVLGKDVSALLEGLKDPGWVKRI